MQNINPLTADQLKAMTGKWVKIVLLDESGTELYAFITKNALNVFLGYDSDKYCVRSYFTFDECGKEFEAYSLEQKHIDRDAWKECPWCKSEYTIIDDDFGQPLHLKMIKFCFNCGRPLSNEAC